MIFAPDPVNTACYDSLVWYISPARCGIYHALQGTKRGVQMPGMIFQTCSRIYPLKNMFQTRTETPRIIRLSAIYRNFYFLRNTAAGFYHNYRPARFFCGNDPLIVYFCNIGIAA